MSFLPDHKGPEYPRELGATVAKHRSKARRGLKTLPREERHAYGEAVEQAIKAKLRSEFIRSACEPGQQPKCASGTWHSSGEAIDAAIREQHRRALASYPSQVRRARTAEQWQKMYEQAMREKQMRDQWQPASGYRTKGGKSKWRCWNEARSAGHQQLETANGRPWLFDTIEAAQHKCDELNRRGA